MPEPATGEAMPDNGPYDSDRQAHAAAVAAIPPEGGWSILRRDQNRELLARALESAGVERGRYDDRVIEWLSGYGDAVCAVVAGLIARAHEAGKAAAPAGAEESP